MHAPGELKCTRGLSDVRAPIQILHSVQRKCGTSYYTGSPVPPGDQGNCITIGKELGVRMCA